MKNLFEAPEMEIVMIAVEDVITTSEGGEDPNPDTGEGGLPIV